MSLDSYFAEKRAHIEEELSSLLTQDDPEIAPLFEAARYSVLGPAKRLRPLLVLAVAETFGAEEKEALRPACAIELLHTYSLIHDDLPCMDDDDIRRGKPSLHKVYPEGHALLTGDFLLTYAFEVIAKAPYLSSDERLELLSTLSSYGGHAGMIGGQVLDLRYLKQPIDIDILTKMHKGKTAALITSCFAFGAIIAAVSEKEKKILLAVGDKLGMAFQIVDDLLDAGEERPSAVSLLGKEGASREAEKLYNEALSLLDSLTVKTPLLQVLAEKMARRST